MAPVAKKRPVTKPQLIPTNQFSSGTVFTDVIKRQWALGTAIGQGGFGVIYLARSVNDPKTEFKYVMKVEPFANGPLYCETNCYIRIAKPEIIADWKTSSKVTNLGMPRFVANGNHEQNREKYRFLVMDRFGDDLHKILSSTPLLPDTALKIALRVIDVLEYMHGQDYVHADIKALNLLRGLHDPNEIYLVDFGLAHRYIIDGNHREERPDPKWRHNGTQEFCARDSHNALQPSRRGDLESLGYNLLFWLSHRLPWEYFIGGGSIGLVRNGSLSEKIKTQVAESKRKMMKDPKALVKELKLTHIPELTDFMTNINSLSYQDQPNYKRLREILRAAIKRVADGNKDALNERVLIWDRPVASQTPAKSKPKAGSKRKSSPGPVPSSPDSSSPVAKQRPGRKAPGPSQSKTRKTSKKVVDCDENDFEEVSNKKDDNSPNSRTKSKKPTSTAGRKKKLTTTAPSTSATTAGDSIIPGLQKPWKPKSQRSPIDKIDKKQRQSAGCQTSPRLLFLARKEALSAIPATSRN